MDARATVAESRVPAVWLGRIAYGLLLLVALTFPFDATWWTSGVADASWSTVRIEVAACLGAWLLSCVAARRKPRLPPTNITLAGVVFLSVLLLSAVMAPSYRLEALKSWARMTSGVMLGLAAFDIARGPTRQRIVGCAMALAGISVALLGLAEAIDFRPVVVWLEVFRYAPTPIRELPRVSSSLPNPNITAMVLELTLPFMLVWSCTAGSSWTRWVLRCAGAATIIALFLTFSRAGLVAFLVAAAIIVVGSGAVRQRWMRWVGVLSVGGAGLMLLALPAVVGPLILDRFAEELELATFQAAYDAPTTLAARPGEVELVPIRLSNRGQTAWNATGLRRFAVGYHVWNMDGSPVMYDGPASPLALDVPPGGTIDVVGRLTLSSPGTYRIDWDGVEEGVTWFSWRGTPPATTIVTVAGSPAAADQSTATPVGKAIIMPPFSRVFAWETAWRMVVDRPLLGVGPDNYRWRFRDYSGLDLSHIGVSAHDIYLEWLADGGVIGFLACAWFSLQLLAGAIPRRGSIHSTGGGGLPSTRLWRLAVLAGLAAWFTHGLLDDFYRYTPTLVAFWLIAGLGASTAADRAVAVVAWQKPRHQKDVDCSSTSAQSSAGMSTRSRRRLAATSSDA